MPTENVVFLFRVILGALDHNQGIGVSVIAETFLILDYSHQSAISGFFDRVGRELKSYFGDSLIVGVFLQTDSVLERLPDNRKFLVPGKSKRIVHSQKISL